MTRRYIDADALERATLESLLRRELEKGKRGTMLSLLAKVEASTAIRFEATRPTYERHQDQLRVKYEDSRHG